MIRKCRFAAMLAFSAMMSTAALVQAQAADLLSTLNSTHVLTIGTSNDAPLAYIDPQTKAAVGALPDLLRAALPLMGVKADVRAVAMPFSSLIPALQAGRIDMIGDGIYATAKRRQVIDFTSNTFYNPEALDVAKGNPDNLHQLSDLCGHSAGTYEGTTYVDQLKQASAACPAGKPIDIHLYPTIQNVFADLTAGRLNAGVVDSSLSAYALKQNPALSFELVADYKPADKAGSACAFGVTKGNDAFLAGFSKAYATMLADGTAAKIFTKWGLTPTSFFLSL
ncbi:transporter substrate-binding domain-containing protein [Acidisoma silvae]|uniref:Transporter substrate-binding domain-containing protein n=1 Tax=Acidisoma silvae TaxID=2802396 RepID=A0A963YUA4_9PROT|nr:transporter substrate-binding domain-containing protein [Acidisoma silvae]MCB8877114.1 transporter substrate-binding domain-containing protein [Acidisoma silvae]